MTTLFLWLRPPPFCTKSDQNVTKNNRVIFAWLVLPFRKTVICPRWQNVVIIPSLTVFRKTTCPIWPLYIGLQGGGLRQFWMYFHATGQWKFSHEFALQEIIYCVTSESTQALSRKLVPISCLSLVCSSMSRHLMLNLLSDSSCMYECMLSSTA